MRRFALTILVMSQITNCFAICSSSIQSHTPNSRYQIMNNGSEVKDLQTGLIWQRCSVGQKWIDGTCDGTATEYTWQQALQAAKDAGLGLQVPNAKELYSLVNVACYNPAINELIFPNTPNTSYWSSSPFATDVAVWVVSFGSYFLGAKASGTLFSQPNDVNFPVRLVRKSN